MLFSGIIPFNFTKYLIVRSAIAVSFALCFLPFAVAAGGTSPVVVELFTSQGCYSCPPADKLLGELAGEPDIVALSYHVTYWDRLGWPDPFGTKWGTERQYGYAGFAGHNRVYTPQVVVDGRRSMVGSQRRTVARAITQGREIPKPATPKLAWTAGGRLEVIMPHAPEAAGAEIWVVRFDVRRQTHILRGENGGKLLAYNHIARQRWRLGEFDGHAGRLETPVEPGDEEWGVVVLVQHAGPGPISGAASLKGPGPDLRRVGR